MKLWKLPGDLKRQYPDRTDKVGKRARWEKKRIPMSEQEDKVGEVGESLQRTAFLKIWCDQWLLVQKIVLIN